MKKTTILLFALLNSVGVFSQINLSDSTVQTISYWNKGDKQSYRISEESFQIKNAKDTSKREFYTYDVDIEIMDSTSDSYTVKWTYRDLEVKVSTNPFIKKLFSISSSTPVILKVSEMGAFTEVLNWKEMRDVIKAGIQLLKTDFKDTIPNFEKLVDQTESMYSSKEAIENACIREIQQFYTFHGGKYKLGEEIVDSIQVNNGFGGLPFDAEIWVELNEINMDDDSYILNTTQTIDAKQLTDATYEYLKKISETMKLPFVTRREDFPLAMNETRTASQIHGGSGWVLSSVQIKEVFMDNLSSISERIIELK